MMNRQIHLGAVPSGAGGPGSPTWLDSDIPGDASVGRRDRRAHPGVDPARPELPTFVVDPVKEA
jgi:hypothetical protein